MGWQTFIEASNRELRRNEHNRGLGYTPDPKALTPDLVLEYLDGFGHTGCGAREITAAIQRDERGVKRALVALVADGLVTFSESNTRGPKASKRKTYRPADSDGPVIVSFDDCGGYGDRENEYGAGGGRKVESVTPSA